MIHHTTRSETLRTFQTIFDFITTRDMDVVEMLYRLRHCPEDSVIRLVHAINPLVEAQLSTGAMRVRPDFAHHTNTHLATLAWRHLLQQDTYHQQDMGMHPSQ